MTYRAGLVLVATLTGLLGCEQDSAPEPAARAQQEVTQVDENASELLNDCENGPIRLHAAVNDQRRRENSMARDIYRHPEQVLSFFDVQPRHTVVEIWPSGGWWTEILAPYLRDCGQYIAAGFSLEANRTPGWRQRVQRDYNHWLANDPERFGQVQVTGLSIPERPEIAPPGSVDRVLTFRNVHNWMNGDYAPEVFVSMYKALKPGGLLGLVEHRAKQGTSIEQMIQSGYITEAKVVEMAIAAGFELVSKSELNANPDDTKDYPEGVWSLPPSLREGEVGELKYRQIGESDRMTLLFRKPA